MKQYIDLLRDVMDNGVLKPTRAKLKSTGQNIDAISVFGRQLRFDLNEGFPLVTTKAVNFDAIVHELVWFLSGSTNIKYLEDNGVKIWSDWADNNGNLGPVYGHNWRNYGGKIDSIPQKKPNLRTGVKATLLGIANGTGKENHPLEGTWINLISRCYNPSSPTYHYYGGKGVRVCDRWLEFSVFAADAILLPGWDEKSANPNDFVLDKDGRGSGFLYSPETCQWISRSANNQLKYNRVYVLEREGKEYTFASVSDFCRENGMNPGYLSPLWVSPGISKTRKGFRLKSIRDYHKGIDQVARLVSEIKAVRDDPRASSARRLILNSWDPRIIDDSALPPCHVYAQFNITNGKLSCFLVQRSGDAFLGIPYNIASYSLLTCILAKIAGLEQGEFVHSIGDLHVYQNHVDQVQEQLSRKPMTLPELWINPELKDIDNLRREDVDLIGYAHWPRLKAEVAV